MDYAHEMYVESATRDDAQQVPQAVGIYLFQRRLMRHKELLLPGMQGNY